MLHCPRCNRDLERIFWRYLEPVDDIAYWDSQHQRYEYEDSIDKGELPCVTLCSWCEYKIKDYGYESSEQKKAD